VWWLLPDTWRIKYAAEYMVQTDQVEIDNRPYNCEWGSAPLGNKHCHYEKMVAEVNPASGNTSAVKVHVGWQRVDE
jgi:hypothetical protein